MADIDSVSIHSARYESRSRLPHLHLPRVQFPSLSNRRGEARRAANLRRRASGSPRTRSRRFYRWLDGIADGLLDGIADGLLHGIADGFSRRLGTLEHALLHRAQRSGSRPGSVPRGRTGSVKSMGRARSGGSGVADDHNDRAGREERADGGYRCAIKPSATLATKSSEVVARSSSAFTPSISSASALA